MQLLPASLIPPSKCNVQTVVGHICQHIVSKIHLVITGNLKKSRSRRKEQAEVSSPTKKKMKKTPGKTKRNGKQNKKWEQEHSDFLIPYLGQLAREEFKADK